MAFCSLRRPCCAVLLPNSGDNGNRSKPSRLIIPGSPSFNSAPRTAPVTEPMSDADAKRTFRPPMGYFQKTKHETEITDVEDEVIIQRLRAGTGLWHKLATYLPHLNSRGFDSVLIEELTGIHKKEQSILVTAASVLQSILIHAQEYEASDTEEMFSYFDAEGTHFALYELRFLTAEQRLTCARYVAQRQLHASEALDLARSTKEYYRRGGEDTGFNCSPQDILAYKFYRNALESREDSLISSFVEKGLAIAHSDNAKELLESVFTREDGKTLGVGAAKVAKISIHRLLTSETLFRTVPFAGDLFEVESSMIRGCPQIHSAGEFGIFQFDMQSSQQWSWVTLPKWHSLAEAKTPVVLSVKNCADVEEFRRSINVKSKAEALRLAGAGLIVADAAQNENQNETSYYLTDKNGRLELTPSKDTDGKEILARILFVARPPDKDSEF